MSGFGTARAEDHEIESEPTQVCRACRREVSLDYEGGEWVWLHVATGGQA